MHGSKRFVNIFNERPEKAEYEMFRGFNLNITEGFFQNREKPFRDYVSIGEKHLENQKACCRKMLEGYIKHSKIDGAKIQKEWFPEIEADIFISHSHMDRKIACALAGWLHETFGLKCFIDSCVWGNSKELIQLITDELSLREIIRNRKAENHFNNLGIVSQHINTMLFIALQKMIDKTELTILVNTANSITARSTGKWKNPKTYSPWIYTEVICTELIRRKPLMAYRIYQHLGTRGAPAVNENNRLILYDVSLEHLTELSEEDLNEWEGTRKKTCIVNGIPDKYALDSLYWKIWPEEVERAMGR